MNEAQQISALCYFCVGSRASARPKAGFMIKADSPNVMDSEPFFTFSLDDPRTDWAKVALFLSKFSRDAFNAETLLTDAEDSRYRQAMVDKLVRVLRAPAEDEAFLKWLTSDVYTGKRTSSSDDAYRRTRPRSNRTCSSPCHGGRIR